MLNFINNRFRNNKFRKIKDLNLKKIGLVSFVWIFCATLFLSGSNFARGGTSATALPISFGGTGATTQAGALTNLGINSTIDKNSSNGTFPSAKTVYNYMNRAMNKGYISMDNINFSSSITSWTGGDLIYKGSNLSSTATNNKIKVGDKACTTSGQGYTSNSAADDGIPQVGCVLPNLAAGTHAVTISTDGGSTYTINAGNVVYAENVKLSN
ncbi:MAG: IPT/TIG domain-containing protein, partial [Bifidobacteriaceae bacterium]|nr:IPT/TIG domain-containing protein [Bifidobacteriaceae bacterium]